MNARNWIWVLRMSSKCGAGEMPQQLKSTGCISREFVFSYQDMCSGSQLYRTPLAGDPRPFFGLHWHQKYKWGTFYKAYLSGLDPWYSHRVGMKKLTLASCPLTSTSVLLQRYLNSCFFPLSLTLTHAQ